MCADQPDVPTGSTNKYQIWEVVDPEKWVPDGYVCIRVDSRGAGRSPGVIDIWSLREAQDLAQCVDWAGVQPWSNGKVGLNGISYYAENQWQTAALQPKHLAAICLWEGAADFYRDMAHHGGIFCRGFVQDWSKAQVYTVQNGRGTPRLQEPHERRLGVGPGDAVGRTTRPEPPRLLRRLHLAQARYRRVLAVAHAGLEQGEDAAVLGRQLGRAGPASARQFRRLRARRVGAEMARSARHRALDALLHRLRRRLQKKFFGHFLKGEDTGWAKQPKVLLQVRHPGEKFVERHENEWPLARTQWTKFYRPSGRHDDVDGERRSRRAPSPMRASSDGVTFLTEPLEHETEITGPIAAKLWVSSATEDADLFLVVRAFTPDLKEVTFQGALDSHTPIAQGWLRCSHRKLDRKLTLPYRPYHTHDEEQKLKPGQVYEVDVEVWPTCIVLPKGYRLALSVRGTDYVFPGEPGDGLETLGKVWTGCAVLHPRRSARPAAGGVRRRCDAARRSRSSGARAAAGHSEEMIRPQAIVQE